LPKTTECFAFFHRCGHAVESELEDGVYKLRITFGEKNTRWRTRKLGGRKFLTIVAGRRWERDRPWRP
jgi:hypothetical protein